MKTFKEQFDEIPGMPVDGIAEDIFTSNPRLFAAIKLKRHIARYFDVAEEDGITDILTDLRHLCDHTGEDFYEHLDSSYNHYANERTRQADSALLNPQS